MVALVLCVAVEVARADHYVDNVATYEGVDPASVREARAYQLPAGSEYTDLVIGRYVDKHTPELIRTAVILERCNTKQCTAQFVPLSPNDTIEVLGLVDLAGAPGAFPDRVVDPRRGAATPLPAPARMVHPALVLRYGESKTTTNKSYTMRDVTGTEVHEYITVLSLERGRAYPTVFSIAVRDHYPSGGGQDTSLRFDRAGRTGPLSIVATEQRHLDDELACIPPKPTETRWHLDGARYVASDLAASTGCR